MIYLLFIFLASIVQTLLVYRQYQAVQAQVGAIKKEFPIVSVGSSRGLLNRSAVLAVDDEWIVRKAFVLAGFTIFARLREVAFLNGKNCAQVREACSGDKKMRCVVDAAAFIERHFNNRNNGDHYD